MNENENFGSTWESEEDKPERMLELWLAVVSDGYNGVERGYWDGDRWLSNDGYPVWGEVKRWMYIEVPDFPEGLL